MWLKGLGYPTEYDIAESTLAFTAERQVDSWLKTPEISSFFLISLL